MALIASALTTLATAKSHLAMPAATGPDDARVELFINAATGRIEAFTDRRLKSRALVELFDGGRQNMLVPRQWPITAVGELRIDASHVFTDPSTLVAATEYAVSAAGDAVVLVNGMAFPRGFSNVQLSFTGGYLTGTHDADLANLELACLWLVEWLFRHRHREDMGRTTANKGDESVGILAEMPKMIRELLDDYRRTEMPATVMPTRNL